MMILGVLIVKVLSIAEVKLVREVVNVITGVVIEVRVNQKDTVMLRRC